MSIEYSDWNMVLPETQSAIRGAIQAPGGQGCREELGLAKICRDACVCQNHEGASDIRRMMLARALRGNHEH